MEKNNWELIEKVVERAWKEPRVQKRYGDMLNLQIDLTVADCNFIMDWNGLLNADELNFWHDIWGISDNILDRTVDYEEAIIGNFFVPRYARGDKKTQHDGN